MEQCLMRAVGADAIDRVAPLFANWDETLIWTSLQERMGEVWTVSGSAVCWCSDFLFAAPAPGEEKLLLHALDKWLNGRFGILTARNDVFMAEVPNIFGDRAKPHTRYAFFKGGEDFDRDRLQAMIRGHELRLIDEEMYNLALEYDWSRDFVSGYGSWERFEKNGLGVVELKNGELVGGASSYISYDGGIEIEVDTHKNYRRQGIATACGARLILECLNRGFYPSWDAASEISVRLAQKLGYRLKGPYPVWLLNESKA